ncbi:hypothetical protein KPL71_012802 [Citrus sinensis]|uniref:Uncharacterized protein n=1 Tax=Citrus sinensis TaxID=2711 RepID=A0ACB8LE13_CITSI|nr:hypothetical protein KPL71_012802 [Citrus sinensis]
MDRNEILAKLHKRFPSLPQNALLIIYKARSERMQLLMRNNIPADIRWLIEAKVRLAGELPPKFIAYMPGYGKGNYARKRRARRISVACHKCARMSCNKNPCSLGMVSDNREDKIQFIRDGLNKESLNDILLSLEMHPSGYVQGAILQLWLLFQNEHARYSLGNLTINDPVSTPNRQFKNICVLSGFTYGKHKEFVEAAIDLGRSIAARKLHLVYGGGNRGLSKMVSEAAFIRGSQVLGIIPRVLKPLGSSSDSSTGEELVVSGDLATLEALITLASWAYLYIHQKLIGLLNVNNFYDGFIAFLNHAIKNYFIPSNVKKLFICAHTANELLDMLQAYKPEPDPWTFVLERPNNDGNSSRTLSNRPQCSLPSNTEDPRREGKEHCKVINLRSGKDIDSSVGVPKRRIESNKGKEDIQVEKESQFFTFQNANRHSSATASTESYDPVPSGEAATTLTLTEPSKAKEKQSAQPAAAQQFRHPPPFPQRFQKQQQDKQFSRILGVLKQLHINIPFVEALEQMPNYAKFFKDILTKKRRLREFKTVALTQESSRMLQSKIPQKMKDPGSFTIPCSIGTKYSGKALCDLGASINFMHLSVFKQLGVGECRPTTVTLQLADRSHAYPEGKIEDVLVKVDKFIFLVDFIVLDFEADKEVPIILERPFLATGKTLIDVQKGELTMRVNDQQVTFNVLDAMKSPDEIEDCNFISAVDFIIAERLHSCCSKEEINVVTIEELDDEDHGAANIAWSGEKQPFRINEQIQQRELTPDQQEFKVNGPRVKHYMGDDMNSLKNDRFLKDPG